MMGDPGQRLKRAISRLAGKTPASNKTTLSIAPGCTFGAIEEQRLRSLEQQLGEIKGRVNGLLYTMAGAVILEIVMRFI